MAAKAKPPHDSVPQSEEREDTEEREGTAYSYPALKLHQNSHVIYFRISRLSPSTTSFPTHSSSAIARTPKKATSASSIGCVFHPDQAARRTAVRRGARVRRMACSKRSLRPRARSWRMCSPLCSFQRAPGRFMRNETRLLQVASTAPLPIGRPCWRAFA